jgi:hypothetical protein
MDSGIQHGEQRHSGGSWNPERWAWIPAFAGMTVGLSYQSRNPGEHWIPGQARNDEVVK